MAILRATAVLNKKSGVARDAARNVWHFSLPGPFSDTQVGQVGTALGAFYTGRQTFLGNSLAGTALAHRIELADVNEGGAGESDDVISPLRGTTTFTITPDTSDPLPNEVAACLSFSGDLSGVLEEDGLIRPRARRRGRVFLGPLASTVNQPVNTTNREPMVSDAFKENVLDGYDLLLNALIGVDTNLRHIIYSRTEAVGRVVTRAWVNDEFDTVRRRGTRPRDRMERAVVQGATITPRDGVEIPYVAV